MGLISAVRSIQMGRLKSEAWKIIQRDLMHMRNRPFKDGLGGDEYPYFTDSSDFGVHFTSGSGPMVTLTQAE